MTDYAWNGIRRAFLSMAEIQFAAGRAPYCRCMPTPAT